jgi:ribosome assembly protein 1
MANRERRNVCIIAHVDHGKTTLSDQLIAAAAAAPNTLSKRMAGQARYLDSRKDEQERAITMKASCILLRHGDVSISLTDSPGHVDFSSEVSVAARLADGAVLLIDACEGIGAQTRTVLSQAWREGLKVCLCINKIDRLIVDLKLTPIEAFQHLRRIIEQINAFASSLHISDVMSKAEESVHLEYDDDSQYTFSPERGNVVFSSAVDGWGFSVPSAAKFFASKLGMSENALQKALWGDFYYNAKTKTVTKTPNKSGKPLFVQFLLDNVWRVYKDVLEEQHLQKMKNIITSLDLKIPPRDLLSDWRSKLQAIMSRWFPLAETVLDMIVGHLPSPNVAQKDRVKNIWSINDEEKDSSLVNSVLRCSNEESDPVVVFLAKMISLSCASVEIANIEVKKTMVERKAYQKGKFSGGNKQEDTPSEAGSQVTDESIDPSGTPLESQVSIEEKSQGAEEKSVAVVEEQFIGFSRVFGGRLRESLDLYARLPRGNVVKIPAFSYKLYVFMGRELMPIKEVPAGVICGIGGLGDIVLNYCTLSTSPDCPPFQPLYYHSAPILKVAIFPARVDSSNLKRLSEGLNLLTHADPNVQIATEATGENVIIACGELHLERCLSDLRERFCKDLEIKVSEPIVSFRETIDCSLNKAKSNEGSTPNSWITFSVSAFSVVEYEIDDTKEFYEIPSDLSTAASALPFKMIKKSKNGENFLFWGVESLSLPDPESKSEESTFLSEVLSGMAHGFELAVAEGPLCSEEMIGVCLVINKIELQRPADWKEFRDPHGPLNGQVISSFKDACQAAMKNFVLLEGCFKLELQCSSEMLGKLHGFLDQRRGRIIKEDVYAGTDLFFIEGYLPVSESLGFAIEVRRKTRGGANPMLVFDHWEAVLDNELSESLTRKIRKRKGLYVAEQVVQHGEKQRTRKK